MIKTEARFGPILPAITTSIANRLPAVWEWIIRPNPRLEHPDMRRQSRLLATMVLALAITGALVISYLALLGIFRLDAADSVLMLAVLISAPPVYTLNRMGYFRPAVWLTILLLFAPGVISPFLPDAAYVNMALAVLPVLVAAFFLPVRQVIAVLALVIVLMLVQLPDVSGITQAPTDHNAARLLLFLYVIVISVAIIIFKAYLEGAERERAQAQITRLAAMIEQSQESMVLVDLRGRVTYVNPFYERTSGYSAAEVIGQNFRRAGGGHTSDAPFAEIIATVQRGEVWRGEYNSLNKNGQRITEDVTAFPITDARGSIISYAAVKRDISARKAADAERERLISELDAFAHTVAHDLKSPLGVIMGYAGLLRADLGRASEEDLRTTIHYVEQGAQQMRSIIEELLLFASVRQQNTIEKAPLDTGALVQEALSRLQLLIYDAGAQVTLPDDWPMARGYGPWVVEVWTNYLSNAVKYGGQPPHIAPHIELGAVREGDRVRFWVRDNGPGIPTEKQAELFTAFTRLDAVRAQGHGLGLSIVQRIVDRLGGECMVQSVPGVGSTFSFTLPAVE